MGDALRIFETPPCPKPIWSAKDDGDLRQRSLAMLEQYDITAVTSGSVELQRLVEARFRRRIMFRSDQRVWPDAIPVAIGKIESARFVSAAQKRDILHDNAAPFLRLPDAPQ